jgi:hypothetical protein
MEEHTYVVRAEVPLWFMSTLIGFTSPHKTIYKNGVMTFICWDETLHDLVVSHVLENA